LGTIKSVWLIKIEKAAVYSCDRYAMKLNKFSLQKEKIFRSATYSPVPAASEEVTYPDIETNRASRLRDACLVSCQDSLGISHHNPLPRILKIGPGMMINVIFNF